MNDGVELLPDVTDTPLWEFIDPDRNLTTRKMLRQIAGLYQAIHDRENHYQMNTPPMFGDPEYTRKHGIVQGFLMAMEAEETGENGRIVVRTFATGRKLLVVDKLNRPEWYYAELRKNCELLANL